MRGKGTLKNAADQKVRAPILNSDRSSDSLWSEFGGLPIGTKDAGLNKSRGLRICIGGLSKAYAGDYGGGPFAETKHYVPAVGGLGDGFPARRGLNVIGQAAFFDLREG